MAIEEMYEKYEEIPEKYTHLFEQKDDKWLFKTDVKSNEIQGAKKLKELLNKEREAHKVTRDKLSDYNGISPEEFSEVMKKIDEISEPTSDDSLVKKHLAQLNKVKNKGREAALERKLNVATSERDNLIKQLTEQQEQQRRQEVLNALKDQAIKSNVIPSAVDDVVAIAGGMFESVDGSIIGKEMDGVAHGQDVQSWMSEMRNKRPHWWSDSVGAGATGSRGKSLSSGNPFSKDGWNLTEQAKIVSSDIGKAQEMAKQAGVEIGGLKPE